MNNKKKLLYFFLIISIIFSYSTVFSQEKEVEQVVVETNEEDEDFEDNTKFISNDSLYHLNDTSSLEQHRKFASNFKQKYKEDKTFDYDQEIVQDSLWQRIKQAISIWFHENVLNPINYGFNSNTTQFLLTIIGIVLFVFVLFYLVRAYIQKDMYWIIRKKSKKLVTSTQLDEIDIASTNFDELIQFNIQEKEFRIAIRLYYLWLLQMLQNENKIVWNTKKTNADYLYEIKDQQEKAVFSYLSYLYNTIWYGEYDVSESDFFKAKQSFDERLKNSKK